jgi:hypothetical protein
MGSDVKQRRFLSKLVSRREVLVVYTCSCTHACHKIRTCHAVSQFGRKGVTMAVPWQNSLVWTSTQEKKERGSNINSSTFSDAACFAKQKKWVDRF